MPEMLTFLKKTKVAHQAIHYDPRIKNLPNKSVSPSLHRTITKYTQRMTSITHKKEKGHSYPDQKYQAIEHLKIKRRREQVGLCTKTKTLSGDNTKRKR
jgi:hypothetical protein